MIVCTLLLLLALRDGGGSILGSHRFKCKYGMI